ncbi:MAG TPA: hypothetical protein VEB22_15475 [Phycisphaerales bacterium]|nr:hypothetical protein [Phycisphaerales bacterium]
MGSLIRKISMLSQATYGINILEVDVPGGIRGVGEDAVGVVAELPWGPETTVTDINSVGELFEQFCPTEFDVADDYAAMKAFLNKTFPGGLKISRVPVTGAAAASKTFNDDDPNPSLVATARYKGVVGNGIKVEILAGSSGTKRSVKVTIGSTYSKTYVDVQSGAVVTDPGDPFVEFTAHASADEPAAVVAATALTGGADGTAVAADYTGTAPTYTGIRAFYPEGVKVGVLFVAEPPEALKDDINDGLLLYAQTVKKGVAVLCTKDGQSYSSAQTYVADYRDDRCVYPFPRVNTLNRYEDDPDEVEVDGSSFVAAAIVSVDPEVSPGGQPGAAALAGITSLEAEFEDAIYQELNDDGIAPFFMSTKLGCIIRNGLTTSLTAGKEKIFRRRMTDFISESIAEFLEAYIERPLDLVLSPAPRLGPVTQQEYGEIVAFLQGMKDGNRIANYSVDPFGGNTAAGIAAGTWVILISVQLYASQDVIVIKAAVGTSVVIAEAA